MMIVLLIVAAIVALVIWSGYQTPAEKPEKSSPSQGQRLGEPNLGMVAAQRMLRMSRLHT